MTEGVRENVRERNKERGIESDGVLEEREGWYKHTDRRKIHGLKTNANKSKKLFRLIESFVGSA